jgi:hypothetical protein
MGQPTGGNTDGFLKEIGTKEHNVGTETVIEMQIRKPGTISTECQGA